MGRESLLLDGVDLNDGTTRTLTGLDFTPAKKLLDFIKGADSDGAKLLRLARHENSEFDLRILIRAASRNAVLDAVGGIIDKLQEAERQAAYGGRGQALVWTPMDSTYTYTFYVLAGETNLARAEDFYKLGKPHLDLKLICSPFGYGAEVTTSTTTSSLPLITMTVADVPGDVPAECRVTVTDAATQSRDYVAVGLENFNYGAGPALLIDSASFVTSGFAGSTTTRTGAYSSDGVVRATLTSNPVVVCSSAELTHIGTFRNLFRMWPSSTNVSVRMVWRQGRDQWTAEPWVSPPFSGYFWEPDLGQSKIRSALLGTQTWQWRIEAKSTVAGDTLDVDFHAMIPSGEGYGKARRTVIFETPLTFSARDEFDQTAGALTGKTAAVGGTWAGAGDADDFSVETTGKTAQRTAVSDSNVYTSGRFAISGMSAIASQAAQVDFKTSVTAQGPSVMGVLARYTDTSNWLRFHTDRSEGVGADLSNARHKSNLVVEKCVAGTRSTLMLVTVTSPSFAVSSWYTLRLAVDAGGHFWTWFYAQNSSPIFVGGGQDSSLATGGALASGKAGFYDGQSDPGSVTRNYDNFIAFPASSDAAIFASQSGEFRSYGDDPMLREDSTGTYWGRPPEVRGGRLWLPPAGDDDRTTRIAVLARRNDIEEQPSADIADSTSVAVSYRPRWINIPRQA